MDTAVYCSYESSALSGRLHRVSQPFINMHVSLVKQSLNRCDTLHSIFVV